MITLFNNLSKKKANLYTLVLSAVGVSYNVFEQDGTWTILINPSDYDKASYNIRKYFEENIDEFYVEKQDSLYRYYKNYTGIYAIAILLAIHLGILKTNNYYGFIKKYGASASCILKGEIYRSVTALMLHSDVVHLAGNMLGIFIFGTAVCSITGFGIGWFIVLITGIIGNLLNALFYQTNHVAIGASTSVFGAIGFLVAYQFILQIRSPVKKAKKYIPIGVGIALFGILGVGENVDLMGHFFGFLAGMIIGTFFSFCIRCKIANYLQICYIIILFIILLLSWLRYICF